MGSQIYTFFKDRTQLLNFIAVDIAELLKQSPTENDISSIELILEHYFSDYIPPTINTKQP